LVTPTANHLEKLSGSREGQFSIRITTSGVFVLSGAKTMLTKWKSPIITSKDGVEMSELKLHPVHPGEVLLEEFLKPLGMSQSRLALDIGVHPRRINEIVLGKRCITADTALRLARYFGNSPQFWLGLQMDYDLDVAEDLLGNRLEKEVRAIGV
jgi:addiction module HigA family antidote